MLTLSRLAGPRDRGPPVRGQGEVHHALLRADAQGAKHLRRQARAQGMCLFLFVLFWRSVRVVSNFRFRFGFSCRSRVGTFLVTVFAGCQRRGRDKKGNALRTSTDCSSLCVSCVLIVGRFLLGRRTCRRCTRTCSTRACSQGSPHSAPILLVVKFRLFSKSRNSDNYILGVFFFRLRRSAVVDKEAQEAKEKAEREQSQPQTEPKKRRKWGERTFVTAVLPCRFALVFSFHFFVA